ncbi:MAG: protein translocase subunit SecF [Pseudomonadota bacterium]|nr:protein translocase subunit SecF [Pseudomonadota bacterium]
MSLSRFLPTNLEIDFLGKRWFALVFSGLLLASSIAIALVNGLNFGTDFKGGILMEIQTLVGPADLAEMRTTLSALDIGDVNLQRFGAVNEVLITIGQPENVEGAVKSTIDKIHKALGEDIEYRRTEFVGPVVGQELIKAGVLAVVFSLGAMLLYIWFRFEWQFGIAAIAALAHDIIATLGLFALTQMEFNLSTVAAVLTIAGYSINDTVVVFDRVRENVRKYKTMKIAPLLNKSINEMLSRTILTSVTTLIALAALWVFGGEVIRGFTIALAWGVVIGTYSSMFVAAPLVMMMNIRKSSVFDAEKAKLATK